ncbi:type 1 glutamine amidotransferase [Deltaproteobacteria bacterium TL4]
MDTVLNKRKPLIGVTGPENGGEVTWFLTKYMIWRQGGRSARITPNTPLPLESFDGLILGGGADINPELYSELKILATPKVTHSRAWPNFLLRLYSFLIYPFRLIGRIFVAYKPDFSYDPERDEFELSLIRKALEKKIPILGICRGAQLLNVFEGGSLFQEIGNFYTTSPHKYSILPFKTVMLIPQSQLSRIFKTNKLYVNSLHHQAIQQTGSQMKPVAKEENGIIQAIEHRSLPFVIGVQWHPEYMPQDPKQHLLFKALIQAVSSSQ